MTTLFITRLAIVARRCNLYVTPYCENKTETKFSFIMVTDWDVKALKTVFRYDISHTCVPE